MPNNYKLIDSLKLIYPTFSFEYNITPKQVVISF